MKDIEIYTRKEIDACVRSRKQEIKIGEEVLTLPSKTNWQNELLQLNCKYVLLGIPEDIGVRANYGRGGAHTAWKPALESFVNQQSNAFLNGKDICILGHIAVEDLMVKAHDLNPKKDQDMEQLRNMVTEIDERVSRVILEIVKAGKIPLVIGGGHNNAFPIIKGCALALGQKINVINCDPHTDFRPQEGRHSGNGFSYAYAQNYLNNYSVFCAHEQYNTSDVITQFYAKNNNLYFSTYEDVFIRESNSFSNTLNQNIGFVKQQNCGVEIDLDAITNVPTSAKTSSGISPVQARQYVYQCGKQLHALYLHIAEGAPVLSHIKADNKTGKLIAYLLSDFIKGMNDGN